MQNLNTRQLTSRATALLLLATILLATACGSCTVATTKPGADGGSSPTASVQSDQASSSESDSDVRGDLRKKFMEYMTNDQVAEGFALVSEGGFSGVGNGQTMILVLKSGQTRRWAAMSGEAPSSVDQFKDVPSTAVAAVGNIREQAATNDALQNVKGTAFDAFSYLYLHCRKVDGKVSCPGSVTMRNMVPGSPGQETHEQLIATFKRSMSN